VRLLAVPGLGLLVWLGYGCSSGTPFMVPWPALATGAFGPSGASSGGQVLVALASALAAIAHKRRSARLEAESVSRHFPRDEGITVDGDSRARSH